MASQQIKRAPLYIDSAKLGELESVSLTWNNNNERMDGVEGVGGQSDGNAHVDVSATAFIPAAWSGAGDKIIATIQSQKEVSIVVPFAGKQWQVPCKLNSMQIQSESRTGTLRGTFSFTNSGVPKVV